MFEHVSWVHTLFTILYLILLTWVTLAAGTLVISVIGPNIIRKPVLFSEVSGIVLDNGRPLANVRVDRVLIEEDEEELDSQHTDLDGRFIFAPIYRQRFRLFDFVPHETVITQKIFLKHEGREYQGYICIKRDLDKNSELGGKPITLVGDLSNEFTDVRGDNGRGFMGIFRIRQH